MSISDRASRSGAPSGSRDSVRSATLLARIAGLGLRAPKVVLGVAAVLLGLGAWLGAPVADHLSSGGFTDPDADSTRATDLLEEKFGGGQANLVFVIEGEGGPDAAPATRAGRDITNALARRSDWVTFAQSYWTVPATAREGFLSRDEQKALVVAHVEGSDDEVQDRAAALADELTSGHSDATVIAGGEALAYHQVNEQTKRDLAMAEVIAIPLTTIALILVFGSAIASLVPLAVGILAIIQTLAVLRGLAVVTDVSIYAMNMTTALGLALAIDYSLLMVSRYREELKAGRNAHDAVVTTVETAGRTVLFSALTVALALAAMSVFPMFFLRSFAYGGLAVVIVASLASILVLPAALALIGTRINALDLRALFRRRFGRAEPAPKADSDTFWFRLARRVMRRPIAYGLAVSGLLLALGAPFLNAAFGYPDDRVLNSSASARQVGDLLRTEFTQDAGSSLVGIAESTAAAPDRIAPYTAELSTIDGVTGATSAAGTFEDGTRIAPPPAGYESSGSAMFTITTATDPYSSDGSRLVHDVRALDAPWPVSYAGAAAYNVDALEGLSSRLPLALGLIGLATFVVLFLFTGSLLLPLKALVLNTLSLSATFGAMVWVFQEGHLASVLGFTATGYLVANMVVLMFCLAFALSMDYEVFLLSRIREAWTASARTDADNEDAVAVGLARTGRIVTAAAALMAIVFAAMVTSRVAFMQLFGLGLALAVLADATLVRGVLVPAFMRVMGTANWWAPKPLVWLHDRIGLSEAYHEPPQPADRPRPAEPINSSGRTGEPTGVRGTGSR